LRLPDGVTTVDSVSYSAHSGSSVVPPLFIPAAGASRALKPGALALPHVLMADAASWETSTTPYGVGDLGTPGSGSYSLVPPGPPATVTVAPSSTSVTKGLTPAYTASATDAHGTATATTYTWSSSDNSVATVDAAGVATGVSAGGPVTITATAA